MHHTDSHKIFSEKVIILQESYLINKISALNQLCKYLYSFYGSVSLVVKSVFKSDRKWGSGGHFEGVAK